MRLLSPLLLFVGVGLLFATAEPANLTAWQQKFRAELAAKVQALEKANSVATTGADGWLFLRAELRFLTLEKFWGDEAAKVSLAGKADSADPIPAIVDFRDQLKQRGIDLVLMPVPAKAAIYPEKISTEAVASKEDPAPFLRGFYDELRAAGVDVLDLAPQFREQQAHEKGAVFCRTDTHWSGVGCVLAAQALAAKLRPKFATHASAKSYTGEWRKAAINGDLAPLLPPGVSKPPQEEIAIRSVSEKGSGAGVQPDLNSPVLILGDSHTLVFHDFLCEKSGLIDQLALELGFAPDLIGTRGSGANAVRVSLYRDSTRNPEYLAKKKMVVWCFTVREFADADGGWRKLPVAK